MAFTPVEWPAGSQAKFFRVPWDSAYKDVVLFQNEAARDTYFETLTRDALELRNMTYLKPREPLMVNVPYSTAYKYNYVMVENPAEAADGEPTRLFYFILSASYVAPNTTALELQLDVWQSYFYGCEFGIGFLERGHWPVKLIYDARQRGQVALSPALRAYGLQPEGLDIGNEYMVSYHEWKDVSNPEGDGWRVVVTSTTNLAADWGTKESPNLETADGQKVDGLVSGCNVYSMTADNFKSFMEAIKAAPWVAKGIADITAFPSGLLSAGPDVELGGVAANFLGETPDETEWFRMDDVYDHIMAAVPERYNYLYKFCTYPYSLIEWSNYAGSPLLLKPELLNLVDSYGPGGVLEHSGSMPMFAKSCAANPGMRVCVYPRSYGSTSYGTQDIGYTYATMDGEKNGVLYAGYNTDTGVWFQGFPKFALVNDEYTNYLASSVNTRNFSYSSAGWTLAKSQAQSQMGYNQTMQSLDVAQQNQNINNAAAIATGALSAVSSLASGNVGGAVGGALGTGIGLVSSNMQFANSQNLTASQASQNYGLAQWANQGDYEQAIASINAAVQDAALTQPSVSGQTGGDGFNLSNGLMGIDVRYKTLSPSAYSSIGDYWARYGYAFNNYVNMAGGGWHQMQHFTYWRFSELYITRAQCAEADKDAIRGILQKGTTVWRYPGEVGAIMVSDNRPA